MYMSDSINSAFFFIKRLGFIKRRSTRFGIYKKSWFYKKSIKHIQHSNRKEIVFGKDNKILFQYKPMYSILHIDNIGDIGR